VAKDLISFSELLFNSTAHQRSVHCLLLARQSDYSCRPKGHNSMCYHNLRLVCLRCLNCLINWCVLNAVVMWNKSIS